MGEVRRRKGKGKGKGKGNGNGGGGKKGGGDTVADTHTPAAAPVPAAAPPQRAPSPEADDEVYESEYSDPAGPVDSSDEDYDDEDLPQPPRVKYNTDAEDTVVLASGALGFVFFMCFAAVLPKMGIDQSTVMATGMLSLLGVIVLVNFCPNRLRSKVFPKLDADEVPPLLVFLITGSLGVMIGGMFGGVLKHMY